LLPIHWVFTIFSREACSAFITCINKLHLSSHSPQSLRIHAFIIIIIIHKQPIFVLTFGSSGAFAFGIGTSSFSKNIPLTDNSASFWYQN
jgi:hypothetical protein